VWERGTAANSHGDLRSWSKLVASLAGSYMTPDLFLSNGNRKFAQPLGLGERRLALVLHNGEALMRQAVVTQGHRMDLEGPALWEVLNS